MCVISRGHEPPALPSSQGLRGGGGFKPKGATGHLLLGLSPSRRQLGVEGATAGPSQLGLDDFGRPGQPVRVASENLGVGSQ